MTRGLKKSKLGRQMRFSQSNFRRLLPVSGYCRARGNQIVEHISEKETVLGSSQKLGETAEHLTVAKNEQFVG